MSLVKKPEMTEKKVAANRQNQKLCNGPVADERRERIRAALRRFGYNVQPEEMAMRALGEDPADFQELLEALWEEWNPVGPLQEGVVIRLARALWLANRADRMQEGCAVRQAEEVNGERQDRLHARMMRLRITADSLRRLVQSVGREHYVTTAEDLEKMKSLHQEGVLKDLSEIALALFYQLQPPGTDPDGIDSNEAQRRLLQRVKEIFGLAGDTPPQVRVAPDFSPASPDVEPNFRPAPADISTKSVQVAVCPPPLEENDKRYPNITAAEWEARERPRQLLENILTRQVDSCEAQRKALLRESVKGPSPYERAAEIAPTHPNAMLMRRIQDSNFREIRRLTNLLLKIKRYERQMEKSEKTAALHDVTETNEVSGLPPECPTPLSRSNESS
jgi:hypothetical protein